MAKKSYKTGETVKTFLIKKGSTKKVKIQGVIKGVKQEFGEITYTLTDCTVLEDFTTRNVTK